MSSAETPLSRWLRTEMPRHGFPVDTPRAGGMTLLADAAGIPQTTVSRILTGKAAAPDLDTLRKIGKVLGYDLRQMLVHAELATAEEMGIGDQAQTGPLYPADLDVYKVLDLDPSSLTTEEREVLERVTSLIPEDRLELSRHAWGIKALRKRVQRMSRKKDNSGEVSNLRDRRTM